MRDLLQLDDPVVALLHRGDPLRQDFWGVAGDDPPGVVGALHVLPVLHFRPTVGQRVQRLDGVTRDGGAGLLGFGDLGAGGPQSAVQQGTGADLPVVDAADAGFHPGDVAEDFQPFPTRDFQILRGETVPGGRGQDRHVHGGAGGEVGDPDEPRVQGGLDVAVAQPGQHRPGHRRGVRDRQGGPADLPGVGPGDHPGRRRGTPEGGPGHRGLPFLDRGSGHGEPFGGVAALFAGGGAAGQPAEEAHRRRRGRKAVEIGFGATDPKQHQLPAVVTGGRIEVDAVSAEVDVVRDGGGADTLKTRPGRPVGIAAVRGGITFRW